MTYLKSSKTHILIARWNVFGALRLPAQNTLRTVASDELDGVEAATLRRHENRRVDPSTLASLRYHSRRLIGGPVWMHVLLVWDERIFSVDFR